MITPGANSIVGIAVLGLHGDLQALPGDPQSYVVTLGPTYCQKSCKSVTTIVQIWVLLAAATRCRP